MEAIQIQKPQAPQESEKVFYDLQSRIERLEKYLGYVLAWSEGLVKLERTIVSIVEPLVNELKANESSMYAIMNSPALSREEKEQLYRKLRERNQVIVNEIVKRIQDKITEYYIGKIDERYKTSIILYLDSR